MSSTKSLQINPKLFMSGKGSSKNTLKHREKKQKPTGYKGPSTLRKALLGKIRDFQKKEQQSSKTENTSSETTDKNAEDIKQFDTEFNKSLEFLQELSNRHNNHNKTKKEKKHKNQTLKQALNGNKPIINLELPSDLAENHMYTQPQIIMPMNVAMPLQLQAPINLPAPINLQMPINLNSSNQLIPEQYTEPITNIQIIPNTIRHEPTIVEELPAENPTIISDKIDKSNLTFNTIKQAPPYSNLKGGKLPTYRQWTRHTHKRGKHHNAHINIDDNKYSQIEKSDIDKRFQEVKNKYKQNHKNTSKQLVKVKTRTIKYNLGKKGKTVGILIKNRQTRKKIKDEHALLKQKTLADVKDYLREKNLIKAGTIAPTDVLRTLYEQSVLSGDITNKSKETLLHNFINS
jgi:hypothetical protein